MAPVHVYIHRVNGFLSFFCSCGCCKMGDYLSHSTITYYVFVVSAVKHWKEGTHNLVLSNATSLRWLLCQLCSITPTTQSARLSTLLITMYYLHIFLLLFLCVCCLVLIPPSCTTYASDKCADIGLWGAFPQFGSHPIFVHIACIVISKGIEMYHKSCFDIWNLYADALYRFQTSFISFYVAFRFSKYVMQSHYHGVWSGAIPIVDATICYMYTLQCMYILLYDTVGR